MVCPKCGDPKDSLTRDHVLPKWLRKRINAFGKDFPKYKGIEFEDICEDCNGKKGGQLDFSHPDIRVYVKEILIFFETKLNEIEPR